MFWNHRKNVTFASFGIFFMLCYIFLYRTDGSDFRGSQGTSSSAKAVWAKRVANHPVKSYIPIPTGSPNPAPPVQFSDFSETAEQKSMRESRRAAVKQSFQHTWRGYKDHAWLADELRPVSGGGKNTMGAWSGTIVDSLDTLWIMGLKKEFDEAVAAVAKIDFQTTTSATISVFETTIRFLGGLISAYELSGEKMLLEKAVQMGHMLYAAFDTPNRLPISKFDVKGVREGRTQEHPARVVAADVGSLSLEFTRLTQLSGEPKFYDAVQRINDLFAAKQNETMIPGLWPMFIDATNGNFTIENRFTFGGMVDSIYEYLLKMDILLGGQRPEYRVMYETAIAVGQKTLFYRPLNLDNEDILISSMAIVKENGTVINDGMGQHLACFLGGMMSLGSKHFSRDSDLETARKLTDGCYWTYSSMRSGIMPEFFVAVQCADRTSCPWSENVWHEALRTQHNMPSNADVRQLVIDNHLPPGFAAILDGRYVLRPEAIESMFYMYRITGDHKWQDKAWTLFQAIEKATKTAYGYSAIENVAAPTLRMMDEMETFWTSETLKYLYLIFSEPDLISLDEWVLSTEAHPFKRPAIKKGGSRMGAAAKQFGEKLGMTRDWW